MYIDCQHLITFSADGEDLYSIILQEYCRFEPAIRRALTNFMNRIDSKFAQDRFFQIGFYNMPAISKLRDLRTNCIGKLMSIYGTVTRTTEVKPELQYGWFRCLECQSIVPGVEQQFKFTEPLRCSREQCMNRSKWELLSGESVFLDWQKLRVQEHSGDIPAGSMPRSIDVILRGEIVDMAKPGDRSIFTGNLVVVPDIVQLMKPGDRLQSSAYNTGKMKRNEQASLDGVAGLKKLGVKDLSYKMVFIANSVHAADSRFGFTNVNSNAAEEEDPLKQFSMEEWHQVMRMKDQDDLYTKLAQSIAPSVYSHMDVKKGVLL